MSTKNIKIGEIYNVRVKVIGITNEGVDALYVDADGGGITGLRIGKQRIGILRRSTPETAPKYDPCRKFRKGDIVEPRSVNGRWFSPVWVDRSGIHYEVTIDEDPLTAHLYVKDPDSPEPFLVHAAFFKLVTPVEELEPYYYVTKNDGVHPTFLVRNRNEEHRVAAICECWNEEDAQRICDMYNAEYRKEMER